MPITNFPEENIREVLTYLPMLRAMSDMSDRQSARDVTEVLFAFDRLGFVKKGFDYNSWLESKPEGFVSDPEVLISADFDTVRNLITANLRINRFVGGHINMLLDRGYFYNVLERINVLYLS